MAESLEALVNQLAAWKDFFSAMGLRVNMSKPKVLISNALGEQQVDPSNYPCGVCKKGVGNNSIFCQHCRSWIHHRWSNIKGRLRPDPNFKCQKCCQDREVTPASQMNLVDVSSDQLSR